MLVMEKRIRQCGKKVRVVMLIAAGLALFLWGCGKQETISFSGEIETISEGSILMKNINSGSFDKASVVVDEAVYNFDPEEGQLIEVTALPEIKESYPVQVTAVKLVLKKDAERNISDYFPMEKDIRYVYEGMGNEYASFETYTDYTEAGRMQQMVSNGGTVSVRVYEQKDGKLVRTFSKGEIYYREDMTDQSDGSEEVLLMEPLKEGTAWNLKDGRQRTITKVSADVKTPLGTYKAIEVLTEGGEGTSIDYYVKHIGLVKTLYQTGGLEVSSSLKAIEQNVSREQQIKFYYPELQSGKIFFVNKKVSFRTNDVTAKNLEDKYKEAVNETFGAVLTTDAAIKTLKLDEEGKVHVDMNEAFLKEMNAGAGYEELILKCIANTFGQYFGSNAVIITIDGEPFQSGHIKMKEGESIPVETEHITEKS
ncbi:GerMN domain-containing protein [Anoxybacterium hadale]|uniref:GerMN domain-containing protein n=1 Tax=Anoxybacterium hadale TaxID=3408580 RepID=A0ACD1A759_9FIRM|nr:GerMN domain-containing protein [Clostridiales bacterium]